jgi:transketolase
VSGKSAEIEEVKNFSKKIRKNILKMSFFAGSKSAHLGGALSISDIVSFLFLNMTFKGSDAQNENRDRFILSKGHSCLAYYSALFEVGYLTDSDLESFEQDNSDLLGHPVANKKIGIDFSTGSLGMGLSLGIGVALSLKKKKINKKVYVILGDGECNEGSVWEGAMAASKFKLNNLFIIVDKNNFQQTGTTTDIMPNEKLESKWKSFGWSTKNIDGHNFDEIKNFFENVDPKSESPNALIANTIKGKGISFIENNNNWHHAVLTKKNYEDAIKELEQNVI